MLKWLVKRQLAKFGRRWNYDVGYVQEILDEAGLGAIAPIQAIGKLGAFRRNVPNDTYYGAALTAAKAGDCGPCLQLGVAKAEAEGLDPSTLRAILECDYEKLSKEALLGVELALATIARNGSGDEARREILRRWGRAGLLSLAYAMVAAQAYPTLKYALGYGHACVRVTVGGTTVALVRAEYA